MITNSLTAVVKTLTADDEIDVLRCNAIAPLTDDDPHARDIHRLTTKISNLRTRMTAKRAKIVKHLADGESLSSAARMAGSFPPTAKAAITSPEGKQLFQLYAQLAASSIAPSLAARAALLWRIAIREEHKNPRISIAAVDTLNKQTGVYIPQEFLPQTPNIVIQNFRVDATTTQFTPIGTPEPITIEGEWKPVTIEVDKE